MQKRSEEEFRELVEGIRPVPEEDKVVITVRLGSFVRDEEYSFLSVLLRESFPSEVEVEVRDYSCVFSFRPGSRDLSGKELARRVKAVILKNRQKFCA